MLKVFCMVFVLGLGSSLLFACVVADARMHKLPESVLVQLAAGQVQDLIVELDNAAHKQAVILALPAGFVDLLRDYDALPMLFVRVHSEAALKHLLAQRAVVNVYPNQQEMLMPAR